MSVNCISSYCALGSWQCGIELSIVITIFGRQICYSYRSISSFRLSLSIDRFTKLSPSSDKFTKLSLSFDKFTKLSVSSDKLEKLSLSFDDKNRVIHCYLISLKNRDTDPCRIQIL